MNVDLNQIVEKAIEKAKNNPIFAEDLMKYIQYIVLSNNPQNIELKNILEAGNMKDLLEFGSKNVSEFENKIVNYINKY